MSADEAERWGFFNGLYEPDELMQGVHSVASRLAAGPNFAHGITKNQLNIEWDMPLATDIAAEAQAQAICMQTEDFKRAYNAFVKKEKPEFKGD